MGTGKYPEEIMEKVAKAMAIYGDYDGCFERLEEWAAATDEQRELGEIEEPMDTDEEDAEWWRKRARAGLDALGLTVTEEWASETVDSIDSAASKSRAQQWAIEDGGVLVHRFVFDAHETPWEVVDQ